MQIVDIGFVSNLIKDKEKDFDNMFLLVFSYENDK